MGLKNTDLPLSLLCGLSGLQTLDLSGNMLQKMPPGLTLPSLQRLDCSNNNMEDVCGLENFRSIQELCLEGNLYLTVNDEHKAIFLLPKLKTLNGKDISSRANHIRHVSNEILRNKVIAVWEKDFSLPDPPTAARVAQVEKCFIRAACAQVRYGPSSISEYTKWRVEMIAKEYLKSLMDKEDTETRLTPTKRKTKGDEADHPTSVLKRSKMSPSPCKSIRPRNTPQKLDCTPSPTKNNSKTTSVRVKCDVGALPRSSSVEKAPVSLQATHVLQCHSKEDSPGDFQTQLWACAFQPALDGKGASGPIVATCGGESVCLIDCETGHVQKKYKVPGEEFFSLAWSSVLMVPSSGAPRPCHVLAAGGKRGVIKLIHTQANLAYGEFRASRRALSTLRFSPVQSSVLFTGAYDCKIVMWDVGCIDGDYNFQVSQLMVLESSSTPLHLCLPPLSADKHLLSACDEGLLSFSIQQNKSKRTVEMDVTFPIYRKKNKTNHCRTIDGLAFVTDDIVASKSAQQGSIYLWSWSRTLAGHSGKKVETAAVVLTELQWSETDIPYLSLSTCTRWGYVVCGDEKGHLWTYHIDTDAMNARLIAGPPVPATEVLEWPCPVRPGLGTLDGPSINSVAMDTELHYLVAVSDKNMVVVWRRL
ncbi:leucine-rich repeat and WD repeat-containing protein 1 isoform X2 [Denticeps clupeoides]|nr:leucine-rich repeat and WD repeat-containing protein 1 isoform X2 [Denticeps clupeoides]